MGRPGHESVRQIIRTRSGGDVCGNAKTPAHNGGSDGASIGVGRQCGAGIVPRRSPGADAAWIK